MDVEIDKGDAKFGLPFEKPGGGDGHVVEDAKAGAFRAECMVRAPGESARETCSECNSSGGESTADTGERAIDQTRRPGKTDAAHLFRTESAVEERDDERGIVDTAKVALQGQRSRLKIKSAVAGQGFSQKPVFSEWEAVTGGQRNVVMVAVEEREQVPVLQEVNGQGFPGFLGALLTS